ncbi:hypothetical protein J2Z69_001315 [Paenibacillus shirakamiensis]|uniref:Uncharacterized protein n=1 Tax=Paenibacillus shirakamiensis TaxID=1265935 RepID=A0ABS4JGR7_9BACL|nr:hypothetical protein [Paenibacillus shirakamiensis]MBP2000296.1 hypothetical protein [Paenibacillus shirakamiensis]
MFRWLRAKRRPSLACQYKDLASIGITLKEKFELSQITMLPSIEYKKLPYLLLLMDLGGEFVLENNSFEYLSQDIWYFDQECIDDPNDYISIVERIVDLTKNDLEMQQLHIYEEQGKVWMTLNVNSKAYRYDFYMNDDWVDLGVFRFFSDILKVEGSHRWFFYSDIDPHLLVGAFTNNQWHALNQRLNIFIPF